MIMYCVVNGTGIISYRNMGVLLIGFCFLSLYVSNLSEITLILSNE